MSARYIGVHIPTGKGLSYAIREGHEMGCTALQIFTSSPRTWRALTPEPDKIAMFRKAVVDTGINHIISHDTYLVNLCHSEEELAELSEKTLKDEMVRCGLYGVPLVVSHMGSLKGRPIGEGLHIVATRTKAILEDTPESVTLLMETTAGQGSSINSRFEEIAILLELCGGHPRLGVCMDSCHIFAAGYDIRTAENYEKSMGEFDRIVGINNLKAIHLNDSKKPFGSHLDRHDNIGKGLIGIDAFSFFVNDPRLSDIPMVVETPTENEGHEKDLMALKSLRTSP